MQDIFDRFGICNSKADSLPSFLENYYKYCVAFGPFIIGEPCS